MLFSKQRSVEEKSEMITNNVGKERHPKKEQMLVIVYP